MGKSVLLIVVDKPEQRALFNKHLKTTPHSLIFATDGEDGFDRYTEVKPDLVIAHVNAARQLRLVSATAMFDAIWEAGVHRDSTEVKIGLARMAHRPAANALVKVE